eukprot:TRINITY_DN8374_c7_g1_i1.p1 TRINITY_DN8374_c7_g1~~TRINITY_DN8374_c7_g1_i1.p1  ORF type:complete len:176 (+),score=26.09 TRINITY_DN8374_c7_g1_i1:42-530(+)
MRIRPIVTINIALEDSVERVMSWSGGRQVVEDRNVVVGSGDNSSLRTSPPPPSYPVPQESRMSGLRETTLVAERETKEVGHAHSARSTESLETRLSTVERQLNCLLGAPPQQQLQLQQQQQRQPSYHPPRPVSLSQQPSYHPPRPVSMSPQIPSGSVTHYYY